MRANVPEGEPLQDLILLAGDDLVPVRLPGSVEVVEPPPPLEPLPDVRQAVRAALAAPLGSPPLAALAGPGSRVTVAFDDPCLPLPPPLADPRRVVLEEVVDRLLGAGVRAGRPHPGLRQRPASQLEPGGAAPHRRTPV